MKVLLLSGFPIPHVGGLSTHVLDLHSALEARGHEVELLAGDAFSPSRAVLAMHRLLHGGRDGFLLWRLGARERRMRDAVAARVARGVDVVHCHDPLVASGARAALAGLPRRPAFIQTMHGPLGYELAMTHGLPVGSTPLLKAVLDLEIAAMRSADRVIAVDSGQARIARDDFGVDPARISIVFNSVSCADIERISAGTPRTPTGCPYFLVPRRLVEKTGVHVAIEAFARTPAGTDLLIAGDGPDRARLEALVTALGIGPRVRFLGGQSRDEVLRLGGRALAVLVPSIPATGVVEATSIAAIEALACGTPVIASAIGGLAEILEDGRTGLLVPPGDPDALAGALVRLATDAAFRVEAGASARRHAVANLDTAAWVERILAIYTGTAGSGGKTE